MQDIIEPIHRLTFPESTPDGVHGFALSPGGTTALVHVSRMVVDPGAVFEHYRGASLTVLMLIVAAFAAWRAKRILTRPQRRGAMHCRRCNYDVSGSPAPTDALAGSPPPTCPECGASLSAQNMVRGRSTRRRVTPWVVSAGALIVLLAGVHWVPVPHWASPRAQAVADWLGIAVPDSRAIQTSTVLEVDLATGSRLRAVLSCVPPFWGFSASPGGETIVTRYGPYPVFAQYSTATGREVRRIAYASVPMDQDDSICGFSNDGSSVYLRVSGSETAPTAGVVRWSLVDGSPSVVAQVAVVPSGSGKLQLRLARPALVVPGSPDLIVSAPTTHEGAAGRYRMLVIHDQPGLPGGTLFVPTSVGPIVDIAVQPGGSRVYVSGESGVFIADVRTRATVGEFPLPPRAVTPYGSGLSTDASGRLVCPPIATADRFPICDVAGGAVLGSLNVPTLLQMGAGLTLSRDGKFAVGVGGKSGVPSRGELVIWDISKLNPRPPSPTNTAP